MKNKLYAVGIGPGDYSHMTLEAVRVLEHCDVIVGYTVYVDLVREHFPGKEFLTTPMRREEERCRLAFEEAERGKAVAMICSGDAGVYGMAGLLLELGREYPDTEVEVIPGVTAALSGAAVLGAPLIHDFAVISLSDLLTPGNSSRSASGWRRRGISPSASTTRPAASGGITWSGPAGSCWSTDPRIRSAALCAISAGRGRAFRW